jgi:hypothetical protein
MGVTLLHVNSHNPMVPHVLLPMRSFSHNLPQSLPSVAEAVILTLSLATR